MDIVLVGLSHRSAPIEVREKLAFSKRSLCDALCALKGCAGLWECGIISTCNRVEVYATASDGDSSLEGIKDFLSTQSGQTRSSFEQNLYFRKQPESVRHIFRVASGLDAMMVGEKEIVAQVKEAYEKAVEARSAGTVLNALFQRALRVSKRVRTETMVDAGAVSVSSAAVELAKKIFGDLSGKTVMIVGTGQTGEQTLKHLVDNGAGSIVASNRSFDKAVQLAHTYGGRAVRLDDFSTELACADIVISCTSSPRAIIGTDQVRHAVRMRRNKPIFFIDVAVPRDVDPAVNAIDNVFLYNIDDLKDIAEANLRRRKDEVARAEKIVHDEVSSFMARLNSLQAAPIIRSLHRHFETIRVEEMNRALSKSPQVSDEMRQKLDATTHRIIKRLLHLPTTRIKKVVREKDAAAALWLLSSLFGLDEHDREEK